MKLISKDASERFFGQILQINEIADEHKPNQIIKIGSLLENLFRTATKDDLTSNSKLFDRMSHVFTTHNVTKEIVDNAHSIRMLTNDIRHQGAEPNMKDYELAIKSIAQCVGCFSDSPIPDEIRAIYDSSVILKRTKTNQNDNQSNLSLSESDLVNNPTPRLPVCLVLDTSSSMKFNDKIGQLNKGVKMFFDSVLNDELAKYSVEICVISFGKGVKELLGFESVELQLEKMKNFSLIANGLTPMGEGVELGLKLLEDRKKQYKDVGVEYYQPWMVLMTDGQPTDDISSAAKLTNKLISEKKLSLFTIAIGDGANILTLSKFSNKRPPLKLKGLNFIEFFEWLGQSTKNTSYSTPGDKVNLPPTGWAEV
jgi:uncharacterized protein YegL